MRVMRRWTTLVGLAVAVGFATTPSLPSTARAEPAGFEDRPGAPDFPARTDLQTEVLAPGRTLSQERDLHIGPRPRFIEPAATTTEHTRLGLSAWITEGAPFERRENPGGVAVGFTLAWPPPQTGGPSAPRP
jgi:hypothetical protein